METRWSLPSTLQLKEIVRSFEPMTRLEKARRIRNNPIVQIAPSTFRGKRTGTPMRFKARLLDDDEAALARSLINRKYRILQGVVVPLVHWLRRTKTLHYELTLVE